MAERVTISISGVDAGGKALIRDVVKELNAATTAEGKAAAGADQLATAGSRAARDLGSMQATLGRLVALLGAASILRFTKEAIDQADAMRDLSQKTGVNVAQLSVLDLAAKRAGSSTEGLTGGLRFLSKSLTDVRAGGADAVQAFRAIGLSARDFDGLSLDQSVKKIADAFDGYADGAGKSAIAQKIFGRSGSELIPLLHDLAGDGLAKVTAEAEKLGAVMSQDDVDAADAFNDALGDAKLAALGFAREFATSILPPITDFLRLSAELAASVPTELKVFIGVLLLTTAGALGTAAAIGTLNLAVTALAANPVVAAIAVIGALVGGLAALAAAKRVQEEQERRELEARAANILRTHQLINELGAERRAIESGAISGKKLEDAKRRLKTITEELIKVSPEFRAALEKEGISADNAVTALTRLNEERVKQLEFEELVTAVEISSTRKALNEAQEKLQTAAGRNIDFLNSKVALLTTQLERATQRQGELNAAIARAKGLEAPTAPTEKPKPDIVLPDPALLAARLTAEKSALENERALFAEHQKLEEQRNEQGFARGLAGLSAYFAKRKAILTENIDNEFLALLKQKKILADAPVATQAEAEAKKTALGEIDAKIAQQRVREQQQLEALTEDERQKRLQLAQQILSFEATILQARGRTHDATIAQIDDQVKRYELALRQQGTLSEEAVQRLLENARQALTPRADFERVQQDAERVFSEIDIARQRIDNKVRAGLISQLDGERAVAAAERERIPALQAIADRMRAVAQEIGDPALLQAADALSVHIGSLGLVTDEVRQRFINLGADIRRSLQADLSNFLGSAINDVFSDAGKRSDLKALEEQARRARQELAALESGDLSPQAKESVKAIRTEIEQMDEQIRKSRDDTVTWGDAFLELAKNAVGSVQRILGELIAAEIIQRAQGLFGRKDAAVETASAATALSAAGATVSLGASRTQGAAAQLGGAGAIVTRSAGAIGTSAGALSGAGAILLRAATALQAAAAALAIANATSNGLEVSDSAIDAVRRFIGRGHASGGLLRGPGTGTSDSIIARVSNREFIVNAEDTSHWLPFLTAINTGKLRSLAPILAGLSTGLRVPRLRSVDRVPRFAEGGLVPSTADAPRPTPFEGRLHARLELSPDLVLRELRTSEAVAVLAEIVRGHRSLFRSVLEG